MLVSHRISTGSGYSPAALHHFWDPTPLGLDLSGFGPPHSGFARSFCCGVKNGLLLLLTFQDVFAAFAAVIDSVVVTGTAV